MIELVVVFLFSFAVLAGLNVWLHGALADLLVAGLKALRDRLDPEILDPATREWVATEAARKPPPELRAAYEEADRAAGITDPDLLTEPAPLTVERALDVIGKAEVFVGRDMLLLPERTGSFPYEITFKPCTKEEFERQLGDETLPPRKRANAAIRIAREALEDASCRVDPLLRPLVDPWIERLRNKLPH